MAHRGLEGFRKAAQASGLKQEGQEELSAFVQRVCVRLNSCTDDCARFCDHWSVKIVCRLLHQAGVSEGSLKTWKLDQATLFSKLLAVLREVCTVISYHSADHKTYVKLRRSIAL